MSGADRPLTPRSGRVRQARRLVDRRVRHETRRFLAEGPQAVGAALERPALVVEVLATADATARHRRLRDLAATVGADWTEVGDDVVRAVADTVTPQGVVAICRFLDLPLRELLLSGAPARLLAVAVDIRDPGNAGALVRCADAAGADGVVLAGDSVDPYNPKTVRASSGSLFHLPVAVAVDAVSAATEIRSAGLQLLAADGAADTDLDEAERRGLLGQPTAWLFGNEAHGLGPALVALADEAVAVPRYGWAESLNLATAAAVCLYASARAHRNAPRLVARPPED